MDWGALCHRLSSDYGWTPAEIFELTIDEVLTFLEFRNRRPSSIVASPEIAIQIAGAARDRRNAEVDRELKMSSSAISCRDEPNDWERLVAIVATKPSDRLREQPTSIDREHAAESSMIPGSDWLKKIHEELRMLRQSMATSASRVSLSE